MVHGRRVAEWDRTGALAVWLAAIGGVKLDPARVNPYRLPAPPPPKTADQKQRESRTAWRLLNRAMGDKKHGRGRK